MSGVIQPIGISPLNRDPDAARVLLLRSSILDGIVPCQLEAYIRDLLQIDADLLGRAIESLNQKFERKRPKSVIGAEKYLDSLTILERRVASLLSVLSVNELREQMARELAKNDAGFVTFAATMFDRTEDQIRESLRRLEAAGMIAKKE